MSPCYSVYSYFRYKSYKNNNNSPQIVFEAVVADRYVLACQAILLSSIPGDTFNLATNVKPLSTAPWLGWERRKSYTKIT